MKEIVNIALEIAEEIDRMSESGDLECCLIMLALLVELLQVGQPLSVFSLTACATMMEVVRIADGNLLRLEINNNKTSKTQRSYQKV